MWHLAVILALTGTAAVRHSDLDPDALATLGSDTGASIIANPIWRARHYDCDCGTSCSDILF